MASPQWIGWQLVDASFPAGGFAHSGGLEAAVQAGLVPDEAAFAAFASDAVIQAARQSLPWSQPSSVNPRGSRRSTAAPMPP